MENLLDVDLDVFFETQKAQKFTKDFHKSFFVFLYLILRFRYFKNTKTFCENSFVPQKKRLVIYLFFHFFNSRIL